MKTAPHRVCAGEAPSSWLMNWSPLTESNRRPSPYHGDALPTELRGPVFTSLTWGFVLLSRLPQSCTAMTDASVIEQHGQGGCSLTSVGELSVLLSLLAPAPRAAACRRI